MSIMHTSITKMTVNAIFFHVNVTYLSALRCIMTCCNEIVSYCKIITMVYVFLPNFYRHTVLLAALIKESYLYCFLSNLQTCFL